MPRYKKKCNRKCVVPECSPGNVRSSTQKMVSLLANAEMNATVDVQDELFIKNMLKLLGLKVKLPILSSIDKGEAVDIGNNCSVGNRKCHVEVKQNFLWELKETGVIEFHCISMVSNEADVFTKKLVGPKHNKQAAKLCGHNKYYNNT